MTDNWTFFILLIETYAHYRQLKGSEVLKLFEKHDLIDYIDSMYMQYHTERLQNAFEDLDSKLGLAPQLFFGEG